MVTRGGGDVADSHLRIPHAERGNRIGLFGGSFNPPHSGHRLVADIALKRLRLDQVWWLVTPGNPLKDHSGLADLGTRVAKKPCQVQLDIHHQSRCDPKPSTKKFTTAKANQSNIFSYPC